MLNNAKMIRQNSILIPRLEERKYVRIKNRRSFVCWIWFDAKSTSESRNALNYIVTPQTCVLRRGVLEQQVTYVVFYLHANLEQN